MGNQLGHTKDKEVLNALKIAKGQIEGILKMVEEDRYCIDISKQIFAVQSLLKKANVKILKNHINSCVLSATQEGAEAKTGGDKVDEILYILEKYIDKP